MLDTAPRRRILACLLVTIGCTGGAAAPDPRDAEACRRGSATACLAASRGAVTVHACEYDVPKRGASGDARLVLRDGQVAAIDLGAFVAGLPGNAGYSCSLTIARGAPGLPEVPADAHDPAVRWEERATQVRVAFPEGDYPSDALTLAFGKEGFVLDLSETRSADRCGAGAEWPERIVLVPGKPACKVALGR